MATYPTGVKSFTSKSAGQTIASAHVNDIQDEVTAIEAGILQGTAPLNSSHSTVATLSVSGGSTLATLQVNGGAIIGDLSVAVAAPYAQVTASTNVAVANNVFTPIPFDTQDFVSTTGLHSTGGSSNHVLIATSSGIWGITASIRWLTASSGTYLLRVRHNDVRIIAEDRKSQTDAAFISHTVTTAWRMQVGDFFDVFAYQNTGTTNSLAGNGSTEVDGARVSFFKLR